MDNRTRTAALAGTLALAVLPALSGAVAVAAAEPAPTLSRVTGSEDARTTTLSRYFAGYTDPVGEKAKVVATMTVPTITCDGPDEGIGTYAEFARPDGTGFVGAAVYSYCFDGFPAHRAALQSASGGIFYVDEVVEDGDTITLSSAARDGAITVRVDNATQGWVAERVFVEALPGEVSIVQNIIGLDGVIVPPLKDDTKVRNAKIGGDALKAADPTRLVLVDIGVDPLVKPTKIKNQTDFSFKYVGP